MLLITKSNLKLICATNQKIKIYNLKKIILNIVKKYFEEKMSYLVKNY